MWCRHPDQSSGRPSESCMAMQAAVRWPVFDAVVSNAMLTTWSAQHQICSNLHVNRAMITPHASLVCFLYAGTPSSFSRSASPTTTVRRSSNWHTLLSIGVNLLSQCRLHNGGGVHCLCCSSLIVSSTWRLARSAVA